MASATRRPCCRRSSAGPISGAMTAKGVVGHAGVFTVGRRPRWVVSGIPGRHDFDWPLPGRLRWEGHRCGSGGHGQAILSAMDTGTDTVAELTDQAEPTAQRPPEL